MDDQYQSQVFRGIDAPHGTFNSLFALACLWFSIGFGALTLLALVAPPIGMPILDVVFGIIHAVV